MKHTNKKGFTIVELVIVIAVIAILAAVLIPTFSNLIKKANISNDTAIAKNLNTAAITAQADTFEQAIAAAQDAGYLVALLNAKAENCYFVWEDDTNQFLLYDLEKGKVLYSNSDVTGDPDDSWNFVANSAEEKEAIKNTLGEPVKVQLLINEAEISGEALFENGNTVYVAADMVVESFAPAAAGNYKVNLNNNKLTTSNRVGAWTEGANVVISDGVIDATRSDSRATVYANAGATVELNNVQIQAPSNANPIQCYGATMVLNNVTTAQTGEAETAWYNSVIQVINTIKQNEEGTGYVVYGTQADLTVNSGMYSGKRAIQISAPGGNVTINGGTFIGTEYVINADFAPNNYTDGANYESVITINGGNFTGAIKVSAATVLVINGGTFSVDPTNYVDAETHTVIANDNGTWTVTAR